MDNLWSVHIIDSYLSPITFKNPIHSDKLHFTKFVTNSSVYIVTSVF